MGLGPSPFHYTRLDPSSMLRGRTPFYCVGLDLLLLCGYVLLDGDGETSTRNFHVGEESPPAWSHMRVPNISTLLHHLGLLLLGCGGIDGEEQAAMMVRHTAYDANLLGLNTEDNAMHQL